MTIKTFILKALNKIFKLVRDGLLSFHDEITTSYQHSKAKVDSLQAMPDPVGGAVMPQGLKAARNILAHRFNLLGSGWVHSILPNWQISALNKANRVYAQKVSALISRNYQRLDWHLDPKSSHHWNPATWQAAITYGRGGEEVLMPWSLSRMQQLPFLAQCWANHALRSAIALEVSGSDPLLQEFQDEILDFISANPPRWGVNWASPMDAAIRAINWLIAYDIFVSHGASFSKPFVKIFEASLWDHAKYIWQFQEWDPLLRNNHYLSDLTGLIVIAAHFPTSRKMQRWMRISSRRLIQEIHAQFNPDGSNFESSTCYHMLSTELVMLALSALFSLPNELRHSLQSALGTTAENALFPAEQYQHLTRLQQFLMDILSADGQALQIGDNDSGRILKMEAGFWAESERNQPPRDFQALHQRMAIFLSHYHRWNQLDREEDKVSPLLQVLQNTQPIKPASSLRFQGWRPYPGMGLFLFQNDLYRLSVRCGPIGQHGMGGHAHNDQLSITLHVHNHPVIVDPGSYCYTPDPLTRREYRSTAFHNTLSLNNMEQNIISPPEKMVFRMIDHTHAKGKITGERTFEGAHWGFGEKYTRQVQTFPNQISLYDSLSLAGVKQVHFHFHPAIQSITPLAENQWQIMGENYSLKIKMDNQGRSALSDFPYSPEYGNQVAATKLTFSTTDENITIHFSLLGQSDERL